MGTTSFVVLGVLLVVIQSSTAASVPQDGLSRIKRETVDEEVPVIYFPKATKGLRRKRRDWVIPDINFPENDKGPFPKKVSQVRSVNDGTVVMHYSITGPGADLPPVGLFTMDRTTGILYVTGPLDRERKSSYTFMAHAVAEGSGKGENPMEIKVIVIDQNDNRPVFTEPTYTAEVPEASPIDYEILQVTATDADEEGNLNAELTYSIISQDPKSPTDHMFDINPVTGYIRVNAAGLDREKNPKYTLVVQAADMEGNGMVTTANVVLTVTDRNDHAPVYTQTQFTGSVPENQKDFLVVKMTVTDEDDAYTPAWNAKFTIVDGDRDGLFTVTTSATNKQEGIITTAKGLDFEVSRTHTLLVAVENEAPFAKLLPTSTATVVVTVTDVNEVPIFESVVQKVSKPENLAVGEEVVKYTAFDPDTARNQKVKYKILSDPAGWLNVGDDSGSVTVKAEMDRESVFVRNNVYTTLIGAYDDDVVPATGTGTLEIILQEVNDNAPIIEERGFKVCNKEPAPQLLTVTDKDGPEFAAPYRVKLEGSSKMNWTARMNDTKTGIILQLNTKLPEGIYTVQLQVADNHDLAQVSTVQAEVCDCTGSEVQCGAGETPLLPILRILGSILLLLMMVALLIFEWKINGTQGASASGAGHSRQ